jgi:hypothetical protein
MSVTALLGLGLIIIEYDLLVRISQRNNAVYTAAFSIPPSFDFKVGELISYPVEINQLKTSINAVKADIAFDSEYLEVVEISTKNSFATVFVEKQINNDLGFARLSGGKPNPGYSGESATFAAIYFRAKKAGVSTIKLLPSSMVLANDGKGTNILRNLPQSTVLITPGDNAVSELQGSALHDDPLVLGLSQEIAREDQLLLYEPGSVKGAKTPTTAPSAKTQISQKKPVVSSLLQYLLALNHTILKLYALK